MYITISYHIDNLLMIILSDSLKILILYNMTYNYPVSVTYLYMKNHTIYNNHIIYIYYMKFIILIDSHVYDL